jgi:hypothetical protein
VRSFERDLFAHIRLYVLAAAGSGNVVEAHVITPPGWRNAPGQKTFLTLVFGGHAMMADISVRLGGRSFGLGRGMRSTGPLA